MFFAKMTGSTKRKLAIFIGTSKCLVYAEAKYCASEMPEQVKYYECSRSEYCCAFGCCVSPGLHFHHLWYYWILVIIMFLVCSGGGWWYRYRLQGRYRAAASAIPSRSSNSRTQSTFRGQACQPQQARISYNSARNTVLLHRMWKGPQRNGTSPNFNGNATTSTHYQNMNVVLNDANCPYYQLYGPPPSYETVIAQTRGKTSTSTSPEPGATRLNLVPGNNVITNPSAPSYFAYPCSPARLNPTIMDPGSRSQQSMQQCANVQVNLRQNNTEDYTQENAAYVRFPQYCPAENVVGSAAAIRENFCVSPLREERSSETLSAIDTFEHPPIVHGTSRRSKTLKPEVDSSSSRELKALRDVCEGVDCMISQVHEHMKLESCLSNEIYGQHRQQLWKEDMKDDDVDEFFSAVRSRIMEKPDEIDVDRNNAGGLFKFVRRYATGSKHDEDEEDEEEEREEEEDEEEEVRNSLGSHEGIFARTTFALFEKAKGKYDFANRVLTDVATSPQSNPSNNVIAGSFVSAARYFDATRTNTDSDFESKRRLDRSKSLD